MSLSFEYFWFINNSSPGLNKSNEFDELEKLETNTSQLSVAEDIATDMVYWCVVQEVGSKYISDMSNAVILYCKMCSQAGSCHQNSGG